MPYDCRLEDRPSQPVLAIRTRTTVKDLPAVLGQAYGTIWQYLGTRGMQPAGPPFAAYYNMDAENLDVEAGFPVPEGIPGTAQITAREIPAGKVATCLHTGPYQECGPAYGALGEWIQKNGHQPTGIAYEYYLNDPGVTPAENLQTQIVFPLAGD